MELDRHPSDRPNLWPPSPQANTVFPTTVELPITPHEPGLQPFHVWQDAVSLQLLQLPWPPPAQNPLRLPPVTYDGLPVPGPVEPPQPILPPEPEQIEYTCPEVTGIVAEI